MRIDSSSIQGYLVIGMPEIKEGNDLPTLIESLFELRDGDVICIASTIVAKSEGRFRRLEEYLPCPRAVEIATAIGKDPRFVQAVLEESAEILLERPFILSMTRFGHIGVNAGIDQSNVGRGMILLLPWDPQASADRIRSKLEKDCAVVITDTCGRPFRSGVTGVAIGCSGIAALRDWRGESDIHGRRLEITLEAIADEIAGMANMLMGEAGDGTPVAIIRGLNYPRMGGSLFMPVEKDVIRPYLSYSKGPKIGPVHRSVQVIIPFKLEDAKSRLAPVLSPKERRQLALAMLRDVLEAAYGIGPVTILSRHGLCNLGLSLDVEVMESDLELNDALNWFIEGWQKKRWLADLLIVMADLALLTRDDLKGILETPGDVVFSPGRGGGTNMILIRSSKFRTCYSGISLPKHQEFCRRSGLVAGIYTSYQAGCDIDEPSDIAEVLIHGSGKSKTLLESLGFCLSEQGRAGCIRCCTSI